MKEPPAEHEAASRSGESRAPEIPTPGVVMARLRAEALFREYELSLEVSADSLTLLGVQCRTTVDFAPAAGGILARVRIMPGRHFEAGALEELFAAGEAPAFRVDCIASPDGTVIVQSEMTFPGELPLLEFSEWFRSFHGFAAPLLADDEPS